MNFSGTLDETNGMTITRLIERIVHTDTPGELRLHDDASGRKAMVAIRRGMVEEVSYNDLSGDPALTAISQACPWTFEFVADEAGAQPSHPQMISRRPKARAVVKLGPKPVTGPVPLAASLNSEAAPPAVAVEAASAPASAGVAAAAPTVSSEPGKEEARIEAKEEAALVPPPGLTPLHREWIASRDSHHTIHFGMAGTDVAGEIHEDDHDYFRSDFEFLLSTARSIGRAIGEAAAPRIVAIAEPERATGYCPVEGGFLGIIGGAGAGVDYAIDFPPDAA